MWWFWVCGWFLVLLTVIGNGFVIYLVISKRRLHTSANWFVLSLAVADLGAGLAFFPPLFGAEFFYTIDLNHTGLFFKVSFTLMYCSNTNLLAMTVDRYLAITRPLRYISFMTKETIWGMIGSAWITPLLLFFVPAIFIYNNNPTYTMFVEVSRIILFQLIPFVFFVVATIHLLRIAYKVNRQTRALVAQVQFNHASGEANIPPPPVPRAEHRSSTFLIILVMTAFNITYLGGNYRCVCELSGLCPFAGTLMFVVYLTLIVNAAVNPVLYSFLKKDIRKELVKLFSTEGS